MAGPRIFVPGPSVNPSIGTPSQYLGNIQRTLAGLQAADLQRQQLEQDRIFKQGAAERAQAQLDFQLAAPEREEAKRVAELARESDKFNTIQNYAKGAQYAGGDRFTGIDDVLMQDPRFQALDEAGRLKARNEFILNNPSAITPPKQFADQLTAGLAQTGKFTGEEIRSAVAAEVQKRYPTADPAIIKEMLADPKDFMPGKNSTNLIFGGAGGGTRVGSGSFAQVTDPTNPAALTEEINNLAIERDLPNNPSYLPIVGRLDVEDLPGTALDVTRQDLGAMASALQRAGITSPTAMRSALVAAMTGDNNLRREFDYRTQSGLGRLVREAQKAQQAEERLFDKKTGGGVSPTGQAAGSIFSPANAVEAATRYNEALLSRLVPRALNDQALAGAFLDSLGAAESQPVVPTGRGGTPAPDAIIAPAAAAQTAPTAPVAAATPAQAEFQIGGPVRAERAANNILGALQEQAAAVNPPMILANAVREGVPAVQRLFESLTPPGRGILTPAPAEEPPTQRQQAQAQVDSLTTPERQQALAQASELARRGVIGLADGEGRNREESLLIAYFRYLEGQRNQR